MSSYYNDKYFVVDNNGKRYLNKVRELVMTIAYGVWWGAVVSL
jgi:hypothetical protein